MTDPEPYSPQLRTAVVFTGAGTAGAYHAGVLRALHEAGVKIDLVAGRGMGALAAVFAAIDGGQKLWADKAFWDADGVKNLYDWRPSQSAPSCFHSTSSSGCSASAARAA